MKFTIQVTAYCLVTFTDEQWAFVLDAARSHYDHDLKISVVPGGWLYGLNNRREFSNGENKDAELSFRQIDKILKSLELHHTIEADEIRNGLYAAIEMLQSRQEELNKSLDQQYDC